MNSEQESLDPRSKLMDDLLRQQDEAIEKLGELDKDILSLIKTVTDRTKAENEAAAKKLEAIEDGSVERQESDESSSDHHSRAA